MNVTATLRPLTLLFISSFLLMSSHGLSGLLLPVRLAAENVGMQFIGFILSMYSVGFLIGAVMGKRILRKIGLVRTFAMCGSLGAMAILLMGTSSDIILWCVMRAIMGFCIACATATLDTWFNSVSTESNRGKVLAVNQVVILSAITLGQFGLVLASPSEATLFIFCGVLFSVSVTPVVFVSSYEPEIEKTEVMPLKAIYQLSPLGVMTCFICGILYSTIANMLPIYADGVGIIGYQLSLFMGAATAGGILLQLPMGYVSDKFERRKVIFSSGFVLVLVSFALPVSIELGWSFAPLIFVALTMGLTACLYPLSISETFSRAQKSQLVPVLSGLLCVYAIGSIIGPYAASTLMDKVDNQALFTFIILTELTLITFTIYRMSVRRAIPVEEQEKYVIHTPTSIHNELDPRTEYQEHSLYVHEALAKVEEIAKHHPNKAISFIRDMANHSPEWAASLAEKAAQIDSIDTVTLYRALTLTNTELAISIAKRITESEGEQIHEIIDWLIEKEPENSMTILAAITESLGETSNRVVEALAELYPEKLAEFSQKLVSCVIATNQAQRLVDRNEHDVIEDMEAFIKVVGENAPEQVSDVTKVINYSLKNKLAQNEGV